MSAIPKLLKYACVIPVFALFAGCKEERRWAKLDSWAYQIAQQSDSLGVIHVYGGLFHAPARPSTLIGYPNGNEWWVRAKLDGPLPEKDAGFMDYFPDTRLASSGSYWNISIHNPQLVDWEIFGDFSGKPLYVRSIQLSAARKCIGFGTRRVSNEDGSCVYDYAKSWIEPEGLRALARVEGLKKFTAYLPDQVPDEAFYEALYGMLAAHDLELLRIQPVVVDICKIEIKPSLKQIHVHINEEFVPASFRKVEARNVNDAPNGVATFDVLTENRLSTKEIAQLQDKSVWAAARHPNGSYSFGATGEHIPEFIEIVRNICDNKE